MHKLTMPVLSDSASEAEILEWLKAEGQPVKAGDGIVEIESDKATFTHSCEVAGILAEILVPAGTAASPGEVIALIRTDAAKVSSRVIASPLAKRAAADQGIDLTGISGSGPGGRIVMKDITSMPGQSREAIVTSPPARLESTSSSQRVGLSRLQQTVARRMVEAKTEVPHFYLTTEVDLTRLTEIRALLKNRATVDQPAPSINDFIIKASAMALRAHPKANASFAQGEIELHTQINVGIAVAAEDSLVVPTIQDADELSLRGIAAESRRLATKVREQTVSPADLAGGTFTVSNLGMFGITQFDAVINTPQAGILAVGAATKKLDLVDGELVSAPVMSLTLSCDHRVLYGADGARFLADIKAFLEEPALLSV